MFALTKDVAVTTSTEVAVADEFPDYSDAINSGFENVSAKDLMVPRLAILQTLSPQVSSTKAEYIRGAKPGDICDVAMSELIEQPLIFIPVSYDRTWIEWAPRNTGKGIVAIHKTDEIMKMTVRQEKGPPLLANKNAIVETASFYGINLNGEGRASFIAMASTQLKTAKLWVTRATAIRLKRPDGTLYRPALFSHAYKLSTVLSKKGNDEWYTWKVDMYTDLKSIEGGAQIYEDCKIFAASLESGAVRGDHGQGEDQV